MGQRARSRALGISVDYDVDVALAHLVDQAQGLDAFPEFARPLILLVREPAATGGARLHPYVVPPT